MTPPSAAFSCTDGSCREAYVRHRLTPTSNQPSLQPELCPGPQSKATTPWFERFPLGVLNSISEVSFRAQLIRLFCLSRVLRLSATTPRSKVPRTRSRVTSILVDQERKDRPTVYGREGRSDPTVATHCFLFLFAIFLSFYFILFFQYAVRFYFYHRDEFAGSIGRGFFPQ